MDGPSSLENLHVTTLAHPTYKFPSLDHRSEKKHSCKIFLQMPTKGSEDSRQPSTMAASTALQSALQQDTQTRAHDDYEILSDEQIQSLLLEAENRLRGNATAEDSDKQVLSLEPVSESYTGPK